MKHSQITHQEIDSFFILFFHRIACEENMDSPTDKKELSLIISLSDQKRATEPINFTDSNIANLQSNFTFPFNKANF